MSQPGDQTSGLRLPPLVEPAASLTAQERTRYARQIIMPGFGVEAQLRLKAARVLVIGAGGLGSPVLQYLAAAGVGAIGVVDDDVVDATNLQRQVIHGIADVGRAKVDSAADAVARINPLVAVERHRLRLDSSNALGLARRYDLVIDGADNFATRYLVSDAAELAGIPCVWGSILRSDAQVSVFWAGHGPTYRDVFPEPPDAGSVPSCAEGGVLGALCGQVGALMAVEAVKLITGTGRSLLGRLLVIDALDGTTRSLRIVADPDREPVTALVDYEAFCGTAVETESVEGGTQSPDDAAGTGRAGIIEPEELRALLDAGAPLRLVDVRTPGEYAVVHIDGAALVPQERFLDGDAADDLPLDEPIVVYCKSGVRSGRVADALRAKGFADVRSLDGGVLAWIDRVEPALPRY